MTQDFSDFQAAHDTQPTAVYFTQSRNATSRKQYKRQLMLAFIDHASTPKRKHAYRTAPVKPSLLNTLLALIR